MIKLIYQEDQIKNIKEDTMKKFKKLAIIALVVTMITSYIPVMAKEQMTKITLNMLILLWELMSTMDNNFLVVLFLMG